MTTTTSALSTATSVAGGTEDEEDEEEGDGSLSPLAPCSPWNRNSSKLRYKVEARIIVVGAGSSPPSSA